jgi:DNA-binding NarL/FixJ family response regulator
MRISNFILVIDSYLVRKGVVSILNRIQGVRILKEFGADQSFIAYLENHQVDFIIIGQSGFDRSFDLFLSKPGLLEKTILLQDFSIDSPPGTSSSTDVQASIHLMEDRETLNRKIEKLLGQQNNKDPDNRSLTLSPREITILRLVCGGLTNRQIAEKLFLSAHTVITHRKNISSKLGIKSVSGLTIYAIVNNIITIEEVNLNSDR